MEESKKKWMETELKEEFMALSEEDLEKIMTMVELTEDLRIKMPVDRILFIVNLLCRDLPISPIYDTPESWTDTQSKYGIKQHKRNQHVFKVEKEGEDPIYINGTRMVCHNILTNERLEASAGFDAMLNTVYPIAFPYFQHGLGELDYAQHNDLVILLTYQDEQTGANIKFDDAIFKLVNGEPCHLDVSKEDRDDIYKELHDTLGLPHKNESV